MCCLLYCLVCVCCCYALRVAPLDTMRGERCERECAALSPFLGGGSIELATAAKDITVYAYDVFTPPREDWINGADAYLRKK